MRIFKGRFTKSPLKQGLERQFQHITTNKKRGVNRVFRVYYQLGLSAPNPKHKGLFEKSPLESQKLPQNKMVVGAKILLPAFRKIIVTEVKM